MNAMHTPSAEELREANDLLIRFELEVDAANAAGATDRQILPLLRKREGLRGWISAAESRGIVRKSLRDTLASEVSA